MKIRIAVVGDLPENAQLYGEIDILVRQISGYMSKDHPDHEIQLLTSSIYTGERWHVWNQSHHFAVRAYKMGGVELCYKADVILAVWDEETTGDGGATWHFLQRAYEKKVPCIWISEKTQGTYCLWDSYYAAYSARYLESALEPLPAEELRAVPVQEQKGGLLSFWMKRRSAFLKKHKAENHVFPSVADAIMDEKFSMEPDAAGGEAVRECLLKKFHEFDEAAIELNSRFQAMLYQRSALPFVATIALAVGFYASLLEVFPFMVPLHMDGGNLVVKTIVASVAGIGFIAHAILNLYVYGLSKSRRIQRWQADFVDARRMAESLRVLLHFAPYEIELDFRKLCSGDAKRFMQIRHLTDDVEPVEIKKSEKAEKTAEYALRHIKEMLQDQLAYHEASVNRYEHIVKKLESWGKALLYISFGMVLARGFLQFGIAIAKDIVGIQYAASEEGVPAALRVISSKYMGSFLNMLALILPAWAGYFSLKLSQNNFRYNYNNHTHMVSRLGHMLERTENLLKQDRISDEVVAGLSEEIAELMLNEDTAEWTYQYMNSTIKPL